jgi:hypothetical protein
MVTRALSSFTAQRCTERKIQLMCSQLLLLLKLMAVVGEKNTPGLGQYWPKMGPCWRQVGVQCGVSVVAANALSQLAWLTCHLPLRRGRWRRGGGVAQSNLSRPAWSAINPSRGDWGESVRWSGMAGTDDQLGRSSLLPPALQVWGGGHELQGGCCRMGPLSLYGDRSALNEVSSILKS